MSFFRSCNFLELWKYGILTLLFLYKYNCIKDYAFSLYDMQAALVVNAKHI